MIVQRRNNFNFFTTLDGRFLFFIINKKENYAI